MLTSNGEITEKNVQIGVNMQLPPVLPGLGFP